MKTIITFFVLAFLAFAMLACSKNEPSTGFNAPKTETLMLRIESIDADSNLTHSPIVAVDITVQN